MKLRLATTALLFTAASLVSAAQAQEDKKQLAFIVNAASDFWNLPKPA